MKNNLPTEFKQAVFNYFKTKYHDGTGFFKEGTKDAVCKAVLDVCNKNGIGVEIVPGFIRLCLADGSSRLFDKSNAYIGKSYPKDTQDVVGKFFKRSKKTV